MTDLRTSDFNYDLPSNRIAQRPRPYDAQRMLIYDRAKDSVSHKKFGSLPDVLPSNSVLVINDSKVVPARLQLRDGGFILIMDPFHPELENVRAICPTAPEPGDSLSIAGGVFVVRSKEPGWDVRIGQIVPSKPCAGLSDFLEQFGSHPIPSYVERSPDAQDVRDFQTMFASKPGSIAAPTAGLHFSHTLVAELTGKGVRIIPVTLHVGYGTFRRFKSNYVRDHVMDGERYHVSQDTVKVLSSALARAHPIIAVGTTVTRTLESIAEQLREPIGPSALTGETTLFIYEPYDFKVINGLITNFHYPRTPVMSLTAAFCGGVDRLKMIYQEALSHDYMFYSYGDAMLVL